MINLSEELPKFNINPTGVIHVGGHQGQEYEEYKEAGIVKQIWIEGNPSFSDQMRHKFGTDENVIIFNELIFDEEKEVNFGLANNGASSSILPLKEHKKYYPNIHYDGYLLKTCKRLDTLLDENNIDIKQYNGLVMDVQGVELNVLKSFEKYIKQMDFIQSEINVEELYEGCCLIDDFDNFLLTFGFKRVVTKLWDDGAVGWGDALYIKS
jgi:FkbM family methyltransferase